MLNAMASQQSSIEPDAADGQHFVAFGVAIALFALAFAAFYPCLKNEFITFDDGLYITGNHHVQEGFTWQNMIWAFRTLDGGIWHPLTWLSITLDCRLYGLNPAGHHLTNVLLHAASTALLFLALRKMTCAIWPSAFVAAAFAVHPLHVESVAWAAERKDVLSAFFFVGALLAYASYASQRDVRKEVASIEFSVFREKWFYYGLALAMFVLGMMGKSMVITLPIILLSLDWWPLQRLTKKSARSLIIEKLPYFAVGLPVGIVTLHAQKELGALITADDLPFSKRLANAIISYVFYLIQTFWPARLAIYYPYPRSIPVWTVIA